MGTEPGPRSQAAAWGAATPPQGVGYPPPPGGVFQPGPGYPPSSSRRGVWPLVLAAVAGLVVGAGVTGVAWLAGGSSGVAADIEAVCGIVERTPDPGDYQSMTLEYIQRWSIGEVAVAVAKDNSRYRPLADSLTRVNRSLRYFDLDEARAAAQAARATCAGY